MRKLFHFFIDGLGLGRDDEENPVRELFSELTGCSLVLDPEGRTGAGDPSEERSSSPSPRFFPGGVLIPADAVMGVGGLPQSATGQTSLFTGINAQKRLGYHLTAFPNEELVELIEERSLLKVLKSGGIGVTSANMYTREFFDLRSQRRKNMFAVSTLSIRAAGIPFRYPEDYLEGRALFADITNEMIRKRGYDIDLLSPGEGAYRILTVLKESRAVFFEYFMTDVLGHRRDGEGLREITEKLSLFVGALLASEESRDGLSILITSDHGNAEDLSTADHTRNPVPILLFSREEKLLKQAAGSIKNLTDTYNFVLRYFGLPEEEAAGNAF